MVDSISREKGLEPKVVLAALEEAMAFAAKKKNCPEGRVECDIDRDTGEQRFYRVWDIVDSAEALENPETQVLRSSLGGDAAEGPELVEELSLDFGRASAQLAKQAIFQKLKDVEQKAAFSDVEERDQRILTGTVKGFQKGGALLEIGKLEALLPKSEMLPKDFLKIGSRTRVAIKGVERQGNRDMVIASRASPDFIRHLLEQEVVQIEEGEIEIVRIARMPGFRSKILLKSNMGEDVFRGKNRNDPVRIAVGSKGMHAKAISEETGGEHLDFLVFDSNPAQMLIQALSPSSPTRIRVDEETRVMEAAIPDESLGLVIGSRGMNIRLISEVLGWNVEVMSEEEWDKKEAERTESSKRLFIEVLDVDEELAQVFIDSGFSTIDEIAYVPVEELEEIGLDDDSIKELRNRARDHSLVNQVRYEERIEAATASLSEVAGITREDIEHLVRAEIYSHDDLGDLATDELVEKLPHLRAARAQELIMAARKLWE